MAEAGPREVSDPGEGPAIALDQALSLKGAKLVGIDGSSAGRIGGVLVDAEDGTPTWLVVRPARFRRRTVVPAVLAVPGAGRVWVPLAREMVHSAAQVDPAAGLSRDAELELLEHYGFPLDQERATRLRNRDEDAAGSIPPA